MTREVQSHPHEGGAFDEPGDVRHPVSASLVEHNHEPWQDIAPDPSPGERIGDYRLLSLLGRGAAGSVFRAQRERDGAIVALKVLAASKVANARVVQRFFDEVRAASQVRHPSLVQVLDVVDEESPRRLAYAMEHIEGEPLRDCLRREGSFDLRTAIHVGVAIAEALAALHEAGIVHRDLKPENIMVVQSPAGPPLVKLLDFGVVMFLSAESKGSESLERPGAFIGTPRYMAPEQAAGAAVDGRADLFSLGVIMFEMITGRCPHEGDSLRDVVLAKLEGAPKIKVSLDREILPVELSEIVDACLQLKPAQRPRDARRVAAALHEAEVVLFAAGSIKEEPEGSRSRQAPGAQAPSPQPLSAGPSSVPNAPSSKPARPRGLLWAMVFLGMTSLAFALAYLAHALKAPEEVLLLPGPSIESSPDVSP